MIHIKRRLREISDGTRSKYGDGLNESVKLLVLEAVYNMDRGSGNEREGYDAFLSDDANGEANVFRRLNRLWASSTLIITQCTRGWLYRH